MSTLKQTSDFSKEPELDIEALLDGDHRAFEHLVVSESPRLFRVIMRILNDEAEAENILQETFLQAYLGLAKFRKESKFTTWLYAIGINLARASLRKSRRLSSLDEHDFDRLQPTFSRGMFSQKFEKWNPLQLAEKSERQRVVHEAIDRLPDQYRIVVILRDIEENSTEDVAKMLDISGGAVRVRLHRARQALRSLLEAHFRD